MRKSLSNSLAFSIQTAFISAWVFAGAATLALADNPATPAGTDPAAPVAGGPASQPQPSFVMSFVPFLLMFGVIYFLMIRPQQKKMRDQQTMVNALKSGDEILTSSGILGRVAEVNDKVVTVEIAEKVRVKMLKSQVTQVIKGQHKDLA